MEILNGVGKVQYTSIDMFHVTGVVQGEKEDMDKLQSTKEEIDRVNLEIQAAESDYDLNRAAELKYGTLLELKKALSKAEEALSQQVHPPWKLNLSRRSIIRTCPPQLQVDHIVDSLLRAKCDLASHGLSYHTSSVWTLHI